MTEDKCPVCGIELERNYGLMGIIGKCPKCGREWVRCLGKLVSRKEFFHTVEAER